MTTATVGINPGLAVLPYTAATKRTKELDIASAVSCSPTFTGTVYARAVFEADSSGVWRMLFNISGTLSGNSASPVITISGVVFRASMYQAVSAMAGGGAYTAAGAADAGASTVSLSATTTGTVCRASGALILNAEPTWASLGTTASAALEGALPVDVYVPAASASEAGLVNTTTQTFGGRKSAGNSKVRAYLAADHTIATGDYRTILFDTDSGANAFDTNNEFDVSSNKGRFTPTVSGYYLISATVNVISTDSSIGAAIFKTGVRKTAAFSKSSFGSSVTMTINDLFYLTATTDYLEVKVYQNTGGNITVNSNVGDVGQTFVHIYQVV